jgi:hypothetical protein
VLQAAENLADVFGVETANFGKLMDGLNSVFKNVSEGSRGVLGGINTNSAGQCHHQTKECNEEIEPLFDRELHDFVKMNTSSIRRWHWRHI